MNEKVIDCFYENKGVFEKLNDVGFSLSDSLYHLFPLMGNYSSMLKFHCDKIYVRYNIYYRNFGCDQNEIVLFVRDTSLWNDGNQGLVITDNAIYRLPDNDYPNDIYKYPWSNILSVTYNEKNDRFIIEIKDEYGVYECFLISYEISKPEGVSKQTFKDVALVLNKCAQMVECTIKNYIDYWNDGNYEAAIQICEELINDGNDDFNIRYCLMDSRFAIATDKYNKAVDSNSEYNLEAEYDLYKNEVHRLIEDCENLYKGKEIKDGNKSVLLILIGKMYGKCCEYEHSRKCFILAMEYDKKENDLEYLKKETELLSEVEGELKESWDERTTKLEYKDRKFLMPIADKDIAGCVVDGIDVFRMSNIPSCIKFPIGHPISAQLYIGHPFKNELYVPYETSEEVFFVDKVHELCYLLQCLGAEEISITSIKGKSVDELYNSSSRVDVNASYKVVSGDVSVNNQRSGNDSMTNNSHRTMYLRFDPMNMPYLPKGGLIWYNEQPEWQRLVNSRLNGNLLEYSEKLTTAQTRFTSSNEIDNVKVNAKILWLKAGVDVDKNMNKEFKENIDTTWQIDVKFRSIRELKGGASNSSSLTNDEQEYLEEVKACLEEEGSISERERRLLDKFRAKLGMSKERAEELEKMCNAPALTEDEQEYLDEYKLRMEDGVIDEKDRKRLDRLKNILDISDERANEIEKMA